MFPEPVSYPFKELVLYSHDPIFSGMDKGSIIVVDLSVEPRHNDLVALDDNGEIFLARFEMIKGKKNIFPPRGYSEDEIETYVIGAVVEARGP